MKYPLYLLLFIFLTGQAATAQIMSYIGIEQGLSNNTVTTIHKDKLGLMWFGTIDGLNRFDGYSFKVFRNKYGDSTSLPHDIVTCIYSDPTANIWTGTQKGIGILDNKTLKFSPVYYRNNLNKRSVCDKWVNDIKGDNHGNTYVGCTDIGLLTYPAGQKEGVRIPLKDNLKRTSSYSVNAIAILNSGSIWLMIERIGLCAYDPKAKIIYPVATGDMATASSISYDNNGKLWMGTHHGLYNYDIKSHLLQKYLFKENTLNEGWVTDVLFDKANCLWLTTNGEGVIKIKGDDRKSYQLIKQGKTGSLTSNAVYAIYEDELSRKWIGTLRGGINVIDNKKNQFKTYVHEAGNNSLAYNFTFSFCEDRNKNVWIGTDGGGISIWNSRQNTFVNDLYNVPNSKQLANAHIASMVKGAEPYIWIASFGQGVYRFNEQLKRLDAVLFKSATHATATWKLYNDENNDIWATCLRGDNPVSATNRLFIYNNKEERFVPAPFRVSSDILSVIDDDRQNLWMGSFTSLIHANKKTGVDKIIDLKTAVRALYKSKSGRLWIGTYGRGLMSYDTRTNRFVEYTEDNGLCNNKVLNIEGDNSGNIWVSTYNGLSKLNPTNGKIENFYSVDGLQSNQFYYNASAHLSSGQLVFGGIKGFNVFYPDSIRQFHDFPNLLISGLRIDNAAVNAASEFVPAAKNIYAIDHITLPYDKAILSVDFVALEYSLPEKIQYAYFLKGRDKAWNYVGNLRSINYSRLSEGHYTLKIKCTNASGIWSQKERVIYITVLPPWYRTWWAYCLYLGGIVTAVYLYLLYHKKQTALEYEVKLVTEVNEKKLAFFTNISHELRTPLTLIVNPIKDLLQSNGANLDLIDISSVYRNSRRLLSLVDQLLLFRTSESEITELQPSWLNMKDICYEVFLCFNNQVKAKHLFYEFRCGDPEIIGYADREKLEIVLFNLLSNAIKYTSEQGSVILELKKTDQFIEILIKDTGPGIPNDIGEKLFEKFYRLPQEYDQVTQSGFGIGLFLAKKYCDIHNGILSYSSILGEGTTFKLLLPLTEKIPTTNSNYMESGKNSVSPLLQEVIADVDDVTEKVGKNQHVEEILSGMVNEKAVILLIDDDREIRAYIKQLLQSTYTVYEADNTDAGFDIVLENEPDIIVCDVIMKGTSGVEFCSRMKESPSFSHIPIILLTGTSSPEIKLKGIECGADDYITKPFESELLIARIKSMLKGRGALKDYFFNEITLKNNSLKIPTEYSDFLSKCIRIVEDHLEDEDFSLKVFSEEMGMSRSKLFRKIKSISGLSNTEFIRYIRLRKAAELMIQTDLQIKEIAFQIGFQDIKYFREQFSKLFEMKPSDFVRKYRTTFIKNWNLNTSIPNWKNKY